MTIREAACASLRVERNAAVAATLLLVPLHVRTFLRAGALWRDEAGFAGLSSLGSLRDLWGSLLHESSPLLPPVLLRAWTLAGPGSSDAALRAFGLLVGLGLTAALWVSARSLGRDAPTVSLGLLGANAAVLAYGGSLRGYGVGMAASVAAFALLWRVVGSARPATVLPALVASLAAVHSLFHNAVLVAAIVLAGLVVCLRRRAVRRAAAVAGIGLAAGLSLLPYVGPVLRAREWDTLVRARPSAGSLFTKLVEALALSGPSTPWLWGLLVLLALALASRAATTPRDGPGLDDGPDRAVYGGLTLAAGGAGYGVFLLVVGYPTQPWYYLALLAVAAVAVDACFGALAPTRERAALRLVAGASLFVLALPGAWQAAGTRRTSIDLAAARIARDARSGDLVVVSPWYLGIGFERYYRGAAPWVTVPPVASLRFHRYDLVQREVGNPRALEPVLGRIDEAVASGHRVWWVGDAAPGGAGDSARPPADPRGRTTGADSAQYERWAGEIDRHLRSLPVARQPVDLDVGQPVNPYERARLWVVRALPSPPVAP